MLLIGKLKDRLSEGVSNFYGGVFCRKCCRFYWPIAAVCLLSSVNQHYEIIHFDLKLSFSPFLVSCKGGVNHSILYRGIIKANTNGAD